MKKKSFVFLLSIVVGSFSCKQQESISNGFHRLYSKDTVVVAKTIELANGQDIVGAVDLGRYIVMINSLNAYFYDKQKNQNIDSVSYPFGSEFYDSFSGGIVMGDSLVLYADNRHSIYKIAFDSSGFKTNAAGKYVFPIENFTAITTLPTQKHVMMAFTPSRNYQYLLAISERQNKADNSSYLFDTLKQNITGMEVMGQLQNDGAGGVLFVPTYNSIIYKLDTNLNLLWEKKIIPYKEFKPKTVYFKKTDRHAINYKDTVVNVASCIINNRLWILSNIGETTSAGKKDTDDYWVFDAYNTSDGSYIHSIKILVDSKNGNFLSMSAAGSQLLIVYEEKIVFYNLQ